MKEIVVVTTFERDELLFLCLEAVRKADPRVTIAVFSDRGYKSFDLEQICFQAVANMFVTEPHNYYGNSFNLISGARFALNTDYEIVHLIEDDTIIHPNYLQWARTELSWLNGVFSFSADSIEGTPQKEFAAVCARIPSKHLASWYESPCASWNAEYLKIALSHVVPEYFAPTRQEMQRIVDTKMFPNSRYVRGSCEQDGVFLRCIEFHKWRTLFPPQPLATHLGAWGYNRRGATPPAGNIEERIAFCRALLKDERRRIELFGEDITKKEMASEGNNPNPG